jgi:hypothetical protein
MMDHIMNARLSAAFGESFVRIPLKTSPNIVNADALETDWANALAPEKCSYILGNPPFGGAKYQTPTNREQVRRIASLGDSGGTLDYVCAWFVKAGEYLRQGRADFALITSRMHMAWLRNIGGRLKNDYRYSIGIVYNPFPWPQLDDAAKQKLEKLAKTVLAARAAHEGATLTDLYDPDVMPEDLRRAHRALDEAVDRLYRKEPFASDRERVEHLFGLYEKLTAPMLAAAKPKRGRKK